MRSLAIGVALFAGACAKPADPAHPMQLVGEWMSQDVPKPAGKYRERLILKGDGKARLIQFLNGGHSISMDSATWRVAPQPDRSLSLCLITTFGAPEVCRGFTRPTVDTMWIDTTLYQRVRS